MLINKQLQKNIYYFIIVVLFILADRIIVLFNYDNKNTVINSVLELENNDLKKELEELSHINYHDYDYVIGKLTIKSLYNSNSYFIITNNKIQNNSPVINNNGLIGLYNNSYLETVNDLNLSVKINDKYGVLSNGKIRIEHSNYNINDIVYTSGLTSIPGNIIVGYINDIKELENGIEDIITINYIDINNTYVGILNA